MGWKAVKTVANLTAQVCGACPSAAPVPCADSQSAGLFEQTVSWAQKKKAGRVFLWQLWLFSCFGWVGWSEGRERP